MNTCVDTKGDNQQQPQTSNANYDGSRLVLELQSVILILQQELTGGLIGQQSKLWGLFKGLLFTWSLSHVEIYIVIAYCLLILRVLLQGPYHGPCQMINFHAKFQPFFVQSSTVLGSKLPIVQSGTNSLCACWSLGVSLGLHIW